MLRLQAARASASASCCCRRMAATTVRCSDRPRAELRDRGANARAARAFCRERARCGVDTGVRVRSLYAQRDPRQNNWIAALQLAVRVRCWRARCSRGKPTNTRASAPRTAAKRVVPKHCALIKQTYRRSSQISKIEAPGQTHSRAAAEATAATASTAASRQHAPHHLHADDITPGSRRRPRC